MSLIPTANSGSPNGDYYFIENIGGSGAVGDPGNAPTLKGTQFGALRVGDPITGMVIRGDPAGTGLGFVRGGLAAGSSITLGASTASPSNVVLTDGLTTVNTSLTIAGAGADFVVPDQITLGGNLVFSAGGSISGYQTFQIPVVASGAQVNPVGLTAGTYALTYVAPGAGNEPAQPSGVFVWSGTSWFGNAISFNFTAGVPNCAICPTAGGATLTIGGSAGAQPLPATIFLRKLLN
jgi:hypothetical protein